jgi:hypothetical protein
LPAAGCNATVVDFGAFDIYAHITSIGAACDDPIILEVVAGTQFQTTFAFTGADIGQNLQVLLLSDSLSTLDSITIMGIPEPATIALLGLGALALLRRRK